MEEASTLLVEDYEVTPSTMAIIGRGNGNVGGYSRVLEFEGEFLVNKKPLFIIDQSCKYFGSSLKGRQEGTKEVMGFTYKQPIAIDPTSGIYMVPTISPLKDDCVWIAHTFVKNVSISSPHASIITFKNNQSIEVSVSKWSLVNQLNRTLQFRFKLENRIKTREMIQYSPIVNSFIN